MVAGAGLVGLSADASLGVNKETVYGTLVGPNGSTESFLFLSESLKSDRPLVPVPNIAAAYLDVNQKFQGAQVVSGDLELAVAYEGMENLFLHAFGEMNNNASAGSGTFSRNFDLAKKGRWKSATSPALSVHVVRGVVGSGATNPTLFSYSGILVDAFQFSCGRDQPLKVRLTLFGRNETLQVITSSPTFPTAPIANFTECIVTWGGTVIPCTDFSVDCNRNLDRDRVFAGRTFAEEAPMGQYASRAALTTEWDGEKRVGTNTLYADYLAQTPRELMFRFISTTVIAGTSIKYQMELSLPQAIIATFPPNVQGRGRILVPMTFTGFDNDITTAPHDIRLASRNARNFLDN